MLVNILNFYRSILLLASNIDPLKTFRNIENLHKSKDPQRSPKATSILQRIMDRR